LLSQRALVAASCHQQLKEEGLLAVTFQDEEAEIVEKILDIILTDKAASDVMFKCGSERRAALRASKKIHWSKQSSSS
jgi:hypothetical protein